MREEFLWSDMVNEVWKTLPEYDSYQVSNLGRIASAGRVVNSVQGSRRTSYGCSIIKSTDNGRGYKLVTIQVNMRRKNFYVHRLVAAAFLPNPENKKEVNHIDGDKANNRASNLEWATRLENIQHAKINGLSPIGESTGMAKLTESNVIEILDALKENPQLNKTALGRKFGVNCTAIIKISKGQRWKHIAR
jgi:hypothetical protein